MTRDTNNELEQQIEKVQSSGKIPIILPCDPEDFGEFISRLFKGEQTIIKEFQGRFIIGFDEIKNLYHLVNQRVSQQNEAKLITFSVSINFDDDSSVKLNSLEAFEEYNEIKPVRSLSVTLSWVYLIRFQGRRVAEKQEIDLTFRADPKHEVVSITIGSSPRPLRRSRFGNGVWLRIEHTARTWGTDIEALLTNHIDGLLGDVSGPRRFLSNNSGPIGFFSFLVFFALCLAASFFGTDLFVDAQLSIARATVTNVADPSANASAKLDYLISAAARGVWPKFILYLVSGILAGFIISVLLGVWVGTQAGNIKYASFIVLTKQSQTWMTQQIAQERRSIVVFCVSFIAAIVAGVIANIIFIHGFEAWIG